jgi:hypothetical protein
MLVGLFAYAFVLVPALVSADDVGLEEDLSLSGLVFLGFLAVPLGASAFVGATTGDSIPRILAGRRERAADK